MPNSEKRIIRVELVIAMLALLTSACASIAAVIQTHATVVQTKTIADQFGASVWPYVTFTTGVSEKSFDAKLTNEGLGPALIRTFAVTVGGVAVPHLRDVIDAVDPPKSTRRYGEADIGGGTVVRPGDSITFVDIRDRAFDRVHAQAALERTSLKICYCSLLKDCWTLDSQESEPKQIGTCGPTTKRLSI